jgi:hypothetical protein
VPRSVSPAPLGAPRLSGASRVAFASLERLGGRGKTVSGIGRAARSLAVYASQPPSPTSTQHSLLGGWLGPPRRDLHPLGSYPKFPSSITRLDSFHLSQACLAHLGCVLIFWVFWVVRVPVPVPVHDPGAVAVRRKLSQSFGV